MTTKTRSPEEIERQIERERAGLTDTLEDLQDRFSVEAVTRKVTDHLRENGGDIGRSISQSVKDNPMAIALTGVGLAWLIFGSGTGSTAAPARRWERRERHYGYDDHWERGDVRPRHIPSGETERHAHDPSWARTMPYTDGDGDGAQADAQSGHSLKDNVADAAKSTAQAASSKLQAARDSVGGAVGQLSDTASDLRARLAEGTEDFSDQARDRIIAARQRAVEAREAAAHQARRGRDRAVDLFEEQPLIAGALALAAGAAVAAALPRSRVEDDYLGERSDAAMAEAQRVFREEKEKLGKVAQAADDEARKAASDIKAEADRNASGETAATTAKQKAKTAIKRVADAAEAEAKSQDLGTPKS